MSLEREDSLRILRRQVVTRVPSLRKWLIRSFMLLLVLAAYGGTAVGNRNLIKVAEATESEGETFVFHEITETRRQSSSPKRHRERRHGEIDGTTLSLIFAATGGFGLSTNNFSFTKLLVHPLPPGLPPLSPN